MVVYYMNHKTQIHNSVSNGLLDIAAGNWALKG